jgi:sec-independent protein translocase protein TatA
MNFGSVLLRPQALSAIRQLSKKRCLRRSIIVKESSMGSFSIWHWVLVILVVVLLFGRGKISDLMGDVAKGIKSFKKGLSDEETQMTEAAKSLENQTTDAVKSAADKVKS